MLTRLNSTLLALGANLTSPVGPPLATIRAALTELEAAGAVIRKTSSFYRTPAFPAGNGPDFVNAAAAIDVPWSASETLEQLHRIEAQMARTRAVRWGQRTLDLDLLAQGELVLPDPQTHAIWRNLPLDAQLAEVPQQLILPHPRLQERAFVLVPLADVAPGWIHPVLQKTVIQMRDAIDPAELDAVKPLNNGL